LGKAPTEASRLAATVLQKSFDLQRIMAVPPFGAQLATLSPTMRLAHLSICPTTDEQQRRCPEEFARHALSRGKRLFAFRAVD